MPRMLVLRKARGKNPLSPYNLRDARIVVNEDGTPIRIYHPVALGDSKETNASALATVAPKRFQEDSRSRARKQQANFPDMVINPSISLDNVLQNTSNGTCHWCGNQFQNGESVSLDHITPLSKGGDHDDPNLRFAHADCNRVRTDQPLNEKQMSLTHLGGTELA